MFGSTGTPHNNGSSIFNNNIQNEHSRLFGGDRNMATRDIEGAQPKKYTKHVWGHFETTQANSKIGYMPHESSLKSPIFGDSVQPLNRAIPNSSGMVFRNPASVNMPKSDSTMTRSAVQLPIASNSYQSQIPQNNPSSSQRSDFLNVERMKQPTSQMREQNIFAQPHYKQESNGFAQLQPQQPQSIKQSMSPGGLASSHEATTRSLASLSNNNGGASVKSISTKRSPDSFAMSLVEQKDYRRDMVSSQALGKNPNFQATDSSSSPQHDNFKNPIFSENRNYGADNVLFNGKDKQQRQSLLQAPSNLPAIGKAEHHHEAAAAAPAYQPQESPSNQQYQQPYEGQADNGDYQRLQPAQQYARSAYDNQEQGQQLRAQPSKTENGFAGGASSSQQKFDEGERAQKPVSRTGSVQNISERIRSVLSSRGQMVIDSMNMTGPKVLKRVTSNGDYGTYAGYNNKDVNRPQEVEKVQYQSKRENYLRPVQSQQRSNSAQGARSNEQYQLPQQYQAKPRTDVSKRREFDIVGNYAVSPPGGNLQQQSSSGQATSEQVDNVYVGPPPPAGKLNKYAELNSNNRHYNKSLSGVPKQDVKIFTGKALKNLSNIKLY